MLYGKRLFIRGGFKEYLSTIEANRSSFIRGAGSIPASSAKTIWVVTEVVITAQT